jgi:outer membrane protein OmpA-like peptidoglycan-associated protein
MKDLGIRHCIYLVMIAMLMSHCATVGDGDKTWKGTGIGALGGAATGALIGAAAGNPGKGALIGAAAGAAVGTVTGVVLDRQEERLRKEGIRTERDRQGNLLVRLADDSLKFDTGKAELKSAGVEQLSVVSGILRDYPENRINIIGHTDSVGSDAYNQQLSQARADTVKVTLLQQGVTPRSILSATGYGESQPIADNAVVAGRAQNRRVELSIRVDEAEAARNQEERERYSRGRR